MSRQNGWQHSLTLALTLFLLAGCGPSPEAIATQTATAATAIAADWTATPTSTATSTFTPTPTPTFTSTPTPTNTPTSVPPTATPTKTPAPTKTPTATPVIINPQLGITLSGEIKSIDAEGRGTINVVVSTDGSSITQLDVTVTDYVDKKSSITSGTIQLFFYGPYPIKEGIIDSVLRKNKELKGKFTSPTAANGTIDISTEFTVLENTTTIDFGKWAWSAKAQ